MLYLDMCLSKKPGCFGHTRVGTPVPQQHIESKYTLHHYATHTLLQELKKIYPETLVRCMRAPRAPEGEEVCDRAQEQTR